MFGQLYFYGVGPHDQVFFTGMLKRLYRNPWKCDFFMGCPNYPNFVGLTEVQYFHKSNSHTYM